MSFIFPFISSLSIAVTCGYMLYKCLFDSDEIPPYKKPYTHYKPNKQYKPYKPTESINNMSSIKLNVPTVYKPLNIIIEQFPDEPNKNEYTKITSSDEDTPVSSDNDFDIINEDDIVKDDIINSNETQSI